MGIPLVIILIIAIVGGYCCCIKLQHRRLARLRSFDDSDDETGGAQLSEYSRADEENKPPPYTATDPFPSQPPPEYNEGGNEDTNSRTVAMENDLEGSPDTDDNVPLVHNEQH